jgi:hypothetical protein
MADGIPVPLQLTQLTKADFEDDNLPVVNQYLTAIVNAHNALAGHTGDVTLAGNLNLQGKTIKNVAAPVGPGDVVTKFAADNTYGAAVVGPQLEVGGKYPLKTVRRLNDTTQREKNSTYLNALMNTTPTANDATLSATHVSGGVCTVTVSAGNLVRMDDSTVAFPERSDTLSVPTSITLLTLNRLSGVVTAVSSAPHGLIHGETFSIPTATDVTFVGSFVVSTVSSPTQFTFFQAGPDDPSGTGGTASVGGVYYYYLAANAFVLSLEGPFSADTWVNRQAVNTDGNVQVAVVVLTSSGFNIAQSSAGGTSPAATNGRLFGRL